MNLLELPQYAANNLHLVWTFTLLACRFYGMVMSIPGIGGGLSLAHTKLPAVLVLTFAAMSSSPHAAMPADILVMVTSVLGELIFGFIVGTIPMLIVSGIQTGIQLSTTTMGLGASSLFDPSVGGSISSLSKLHGDLVSIMFLCLGGHYLVIEALSGVSSAVVPGQFLYGERTAELFVNLSGEMFRAGIMISAPVIVALLLTQFVMGLMSKAVPQVNIFVISFPLTVGIGMILTVLALPEVVRYTERSLSGLDTAIAIVTEEGALNKASGAGQQIDSESKEQRKAHPNSIPLESNSNTLDID